MKLLRFGKNGQEHPGVLDQNGTIRDLSGHIGDISGPCLDKDTLARLVQLDLRKLPEIAPDTRIGACVGAVGKLIAIGLNYSDHAQEAGMDVPPEPIIFHKATSSICGAFDDLERPRGATELDWEVELGVVIGTRAKYVTEADAMEHVAGYCTLNDASERSFQIKHSGQWTKGKCHDTFGAIGPWMVTADEISDPQNLRLTADVDQARMQNGTTATMVFGVRFLISYLSRFMTLEPGDIIATGTPPGVGMGQKPAPIYLTPGQILELEVEGLGAQKHLVVEA